MKNKKILSLVIIIFIIGAGLVYSKIVSKKSGKISYEEIKVKRGNIEISISSAGVICASREIQVKSKASGEILKIYVRTGDFVKKGQLLLELDKTTGISDVKQAEADLMAVEARLKQDKVKVAEMKRSYEQQEILVKDHLTTEESVLKAQGQLIIANADMDITQASLINAQEKLKDAKIRFADTEIRSPIDGIILEKFVEEGQIIASGTSSLDGGTLILSIGDMSKILSKADVDEVDIGKIKVGQQVRIGVDAYENKAFKGILTHISPKGTNKSNVTVFNIEIEVTDESKQILKTGMTNTAEIIIERKENILMLPAQVVQNRRNKSFVLIKDGKNNRRQEIKTGITDLENIEILEGLTEGETVLYSANKSSPNGNSKDVRGNSNRNTFRAMRGLR